MRCLPPVDQVTGIVAWPAGDSFRVTLTTTSTDPQNLATGTAEAVVQITNSLPTLTVTPPTVTGPLTITPEGPDGPVGSLGYFSLTYQITNSAPVDVRFGKNLVKCEVLGSTDVGGELRGRTMAASLGGTLMWVLTCNKGWNGKGVLVAWTVWC